MKKFVKCLAFAMAALICTTSAFAADKAIEKQAMKEAKVNVKTLKKDGWKLLGSGDLEMALYRHNIKKLEGQKEYIGTADNVKEIDNGKKKALLSAQNEFAQVHCVAINGKILQDVGNLTGDETDEFNKFRTAVEGRIKGEIRGELQPSIILVRDLGKGTKSVQGWYLCDFENAKQVIRRAYEMELENTKLRNKICSEVSEWINAE